LASNAGGISQNAARSLLIANKWNYDNALKKMTDSYVNGGLEFAFNFKERKLAEEMTCDTCFCDSPKEDMLLNDDCNHGYDNECYPEFLLAKLKDEGMGKIILAKCVGEKC
jgi:hypothetical protein